MTREIKFRAWSTQTPHHKMIYLGNGGNLADLVETKTWKVMQFTGLKDANGVEIYEGDILRYGFYEDLDGVEDPDRPMDFVVRWLASDSRFVALGGLLSANGMLSADAFVIGNIYENPELAND